MELYIIVIYLSEVHAKLFDDLFFNAFHSIEFSRDMCLYTSTESSEYRLGIEFIFTVKKIVLILGKIKARVQFNFKL